MKKMELLFSFGIIILLFTSCNEDFLEKFPKDKISSETFWQTEEDLNIGVAGVYNIMLNRASMNHNRVRWDGLSEIGYGLGYDNYNQGIIEPTSGGLISSIYNECYQGISRCNVFLDNVDKVTDVDEGLVNSRKGEILFLRAHFYFTLTEFYGGVPLYTTAPTIETANIEQSAKEEVVDQILADLDLAISYLPDELYSGHTVKGSALALKAKVLMHNEKWSEAAEAANRIITSGIFGLYDNYPELFLRSGQEMNPEILFSVRYLLPNAGNGFRNGAPEGVLAHIHYLSPNQKFVDSFEAIDGLPIDESPLYDPANQFENRDPRLSYTVIDEEGYREKGEPIGQAGEPFQTPYSVEKMVDWDFLPASEALVSDQDYILFRYAQVLLIYAESKNEASGPDQSVYDAVNLVRQRPSVNMPPLPIGLDKAAMRERIRHERIVELGMEGLRYWDIKRWKTIETVLPETQDPSGLFRKFDPLKHYLWPFSVSELDRNPNLAQNPGY